MRTNCPLKLRKLGQDQELRVLGAFGCTRADHIAAPEPPGDGVARNPSRAFDDHHVAHIGKRSHHRRPGHARGPFVEGLDRREVRDSRRTDVVAGIRRHGDGQRALVLEHGAPSSEAASLVEREPLFGRIEQHVAPVRRLKQPIEEPRAVATALCGGGDDDHPGGGIGLSVVPPHGRADHVACPLQDQALADHRGKFPILAAIRPGHLLRQLQRARHMAGFEFHQLDRER